MSAGYQMNNPEGFAQEVANLGIDPDFYDKVGVVGLWSGSGYILDYYAIGVLNEDENALLESVVDGMPDEDWKVLVLDEVQAREWTDGEDPFECEELIYVDPGSFVLAENLSIKFFTQEDFGKATKLYGTCDGNYVRKICRRA